MTTSRKAPESRRPESAAAKAIRTIVEGANRVFDALQPQPRLQPIPVRVRGGRRDPRR